MKSQSFLRLADSSELRNEFASHIIQKTLENKGKKYPYNSEKRGWKK